MPHRFLLAGSVVYLVAANLIWVARDTRPPFWDMAYHQTSALRIVDAFAADGLDAMTSVPGLTGYYPPFYPGLVALSFAVVDRTPDAAQLANLAAIPVLLLATYLLARRVVSSLTAVAAAMITSFSPFMAWLSRETLIDYWLTTWVAVALLLLCQTGGFQRRDRSIAFGIACGLGMLTKWTFGFFVALPFLHAARRHPRNAIMAAAIAALIASVWYVPRASSLTELLAINTAGAAAEGDPSRFSLQALIFYWRALEGYQLFLPVFLLFLAGLLTMRSRYSAAWTPVLLGLLSGWLGLLLFENKDPRYSVPLLPVVAVVAAAILDNRQKWIAPLAVLLVAQHYVVSFGVRSIPQSVVVMRGVDGPLAWNWNLYTQHYMGLWGRPERQDWKIESTLERITREPRARGAEIVRLGLVPDIPRFDSHAFGYFIALGRHPVILNRIWEVRSESILANDYILISENDQGFADRFTSAIPAIHAFIRDHPSNFLPMDDFPLPNGALIRLYRVRS